MNTATSRRLAFLERTRVDVWASKAGISLSPGQRITAHATTLVRAAAVVESFACLGTVLSIFAGIRIALQTRPDPASFTSTSYHPYVAVGIGLAILSLWFGLATALIARAIRIYAEQSMLAHTETPDSRSC